MRKIKVAHCFFEQSGTFKNEFKKLGIKAFDYDILNDFNQTNYKIDLFKEIEFAYVGGASIFDKIGQDELIFAFFPCIRFEVQQIMNFQGTNSGFKNFDLPTKLAYDLCYHKELHELYELITKLVIVCLRKNIPLIIENPYSTQHYLTRYWCIKPKIIDLDRKAQGDYYVKPTQYWFINDNPEDNIILDEPIANYPLKRIDDENTVNRSMISPEYARRFIRQHIIQGEQNDYEIKKGDKNN